MYLQIIKDFFGRKDIKYFLIFSLICYSLFIILSMISDIDYHKKNRKKKFNKIKLENQKQTSVSKSEI
tara:strand:+ start:156 stop:359 length:204 start_codon:yes stop_codon:yes gene_type:complete